MEWFKKYQYLLLSGLAGAILACFILSYGFFKTLFVLDLRHSRSWNWILYSTKTII